MIIELVTDTVSHDEAEEAVGRMIASHFNKHYHEHMRASIPANPRRDDDIRLLAYIAQRRNVDTELAAERAKVNYLEQSKIPAREEIIQEERSKVKELEENYSSVSKLAASTFAKNCQLVSEKHELSAQYAAVREALEENHLTFQRLNLHPCVGTEASYALDRSYQKTRKALSLTPSEAAEMVRKKDEALKLAVKTFKHINAVGGCGYAIHGFCDKVIEAARAAGVEVDG